MTGAASQIAPEKLQLLVDRMEIGDVVVRFATGIDRHDWTVYRSCFADEVEVDLSALLGIAPRRVSADEWTKFVASEQMGFAATQHISSGQLRSRLAETRAVMAHPTGFEPVTYAFGG